MKREQTSEGVPGRAKANRKRRQFITALARGLDVMRAFRADDPPLSNQELAKRTGLPRPTISRITYTLTEQGYLSYHDGLGCYDLGGAVLALGNVAKATFNVLSRARPAMRRMADLSDGSVGLGSREGLHMVYLEACQGPAIVGLRFEVGYRVPLVGTATGSAYLAATSADERAKLIEQLARKEKRNRDEVSDFAQTACKQLEAYGFCFSLGGWRADIHGVAVPIAAPELNRLFVLNWGGPAYMFPKSKVMQDVGPELRRTADEIKAALGFSAPTQVSGRVNTRHRSIDSASGSKRPQAPR
jgi:DNA-binding IclR family transcriptional regulator